MTTTSYEHQHQIDTETAPQWQTSNIVRDDKALGTVIEKISTIDVPNGEYMRGEDLRSQAEYQVRGTQPSIEVPLRADMVITEPDNPNKYTYLHLLSGSVDCFNIVRGEDGFVANVSQHIPFDQFELSIPKGSRKLIALRGEVEGIDRQSGGVEHRELEPEFIEDLTTFDGCRQAAASVDPATLIRERRKKGLMGFLKRVV